MEKITTVSTGKEPADSYSDSINPIPKGGIAERSAKIKKIQTTAMILLFFAAVINFLESQFAVRRQLHHS